MSILDKKTRGDLVKLVIFIVVTTLATGVLVVLIGNLTFHVDPPLQGRVLRRDRRGQGRRHPDRRRQGRQRQGRQDRRPQPRRWSPSTWPKSSIVTKSSTATIRYRNLVGQRYISLTQGVGDLDRLPEDATIPMSRTQPALDLTVLFNGFKPLFAALSPADINKLSAEVISVFQGEGGNLNALLQSTASLTNTLADRDQVIGDLIDNLNDVLATLAGRDKELSQLIIQFKNFMAGLVKDKDAILGSLDSVSALANETSDLAVGIRPPFVEDVKELREVATNLNKGRAELDRAMQILPIKLKKIGRTAINGSFFNFYLCQFQGNVMLPAAGSCPIDVPHRWPEVADEVQPAMSIPFRERNPVTIGAISIAVILFALLVVAFQAGDLPLIGGGDTYHAAFTESGGLKPNDEVRIAGVRVGKVTGVELDGNKVDATFKVNTPSKFGTETVRRSRSRPCWARCSSPSSPRAPASSRRTRRSRSRAPSRRTTWSRPSPAWPTGPSGSTSTSWPSRSTPWPP